MFYLFSCSFSQIFALFSLAYSSHSLKNWKCYLPDNSKDIFCLSVSLESSLTVQAGVLISEQNKQNTFMLKWPNNSNYTKSDNYEYNLCLVKRINKYTYVKKVHFALEQATRVQWGGIEVYLYSFFVLGVRWEWVVNDTLPPLYPQECFCILNVGGWMGTRDVLNVCGKARLPPGFDPRQSSHERIAIPTALSRLTTYLRTDG